jgi:hypothetical protein
MKEEVDSFLRGQQAGFHKNRSCTDQIASLRSFGGYVHSKLDGIVERVYHIDKIIEAFTTIKPLHLNDVSET